MSMFRYVLVQATEMMPRRPCMRVLGEEATLGDILQWWPPPPGGYIPPKGVSVGWQTERNWARGRWPPGVIPPKDRRVPPPRSFPSGIPIPFSLIDQPPFFCSFVYRLPVPLFYRVLRYAQ
jgi:hypothetical protein